jgi:hypothetical protein
MRVASSSMCSDAVASRVLSILPHPLRATVPARPCGGLLFHLCLGLVGSCLLIGQIFGRIRIRGLKRHIRYASHEG